MDSANSSSLQPSGGGDDEFDPRTDSLSAFFRSSTAQSAAATFQPPPPPSSSSRNCHVFDSLSYLDSSSFLLPNFPSQITTLSSSPPATVICRAAGVGVGPSSVQPPEKSYATAAATAPPLGSRKRSRASRRAPTTMLITDTSNFRAMVQQFTGIPSPPLAGARLDLLHSASLLPHPLMPKVQAPSFAPISSTSFANTSAATATAISTSINPSQPSLNLQSPTLTFQSLLQPALHSKHTLPTMPAAFDTRPQTAGAAGYSFHELGLTPGLIASEGLHSIHAAVSGQEGRHRARLRPVVAGNYTTGSQQIVSGGKLNSSGSSSSSSFIGEKGKESVAATRGAGMLDSWICSSD